MKVRIVTAAAALLAIGTMFAAAQGGKDPQAPKQGPETGMPSDKGETKGKKGGGGGAPPMEKEKNPQAPKQTPETGMPSDKPK